MKIISWNVNGIRSVYNKGVFEPWFLKEQADFVNLQEIKALPQQIPNTMFFPGPYNTYVSSAEKKGYSGVLTYSKEKAIKVEDTIGFKRFDSEGRMLKLKYEKFTLFNLYIPNGSRDKINLTYKLGFYDFFLTELEKIKNENVVLVGDFNIAHTEDDLARPKENKDNIMFTLEERVQLDRLMDLGFVDTLRLFKKGNGYYSWWAYGKGIRERNIGWRIDYVFVSKSLKQYVKDAFILKDVTGSDHCPVGIELKI